MNMIYRTDGPAWTVWTPNRRLIAEHLNEAMICMYKARRWLYEGNRYNSLIWRKAARYQIELARRERVGLGGVYGIHQGN